MYAYNMQHLSTAVICHEIILQNHGITKSSSYRVQNHDVPKVLHRQSSQVNQHFICLQFCYANSTVLIA